MTRCHSQHHKEDIKSRTTCQHVIRITIAWIEKKHTYEKASPDYNQHQMTSSHRATIDRNEISNHTTPNPSNNCHLWLLSTSTSIKFPNNSTFVIFSSSGMIVIFKCIFWQHFKSPVEWYQRRYPPNFIHGVLLILVDKKRPKVLPSTLFGATLIGPHPRYIWVKEGPNKMGSFWGLGVNEGRYKSFSHLGVKIIFQPQTVSNGFIFIGYTDHPQIHLLYYAKY